MATGKKCIDMENSVSEGVGKAYTNGFGRHGRGGDVRIYA